MATKSIYHKTDEMGAFFGTKFYTTNQDLKEKNKVYVISSKGKDEQLVPFLEGCFSVEKTVPGDYRVGGRDYKYKATLIAITKPDQTIDITSIRLRLGKKKFASRFMNEVKPILNPDEIDEFDSLLSKVSSAVQAPEVVGDRLPKDIQESGVVG